MDFVTPEIAAHVLCHYGLGGRPAPQFYARIIQALDAADVENFNLLTDAFPGYGQAVAAYLSDSDAVAELQRLAAA